jgi:hypothetical protein
MYEMTEEQKQALKTIRYSIINARSVGLEINYLPMYSNGARYIAIVLPEISPEEFLDAGKERPLPTEPLSGG